MFPPGVPDGPCTERDCPLCEWENAAVDWHGEAVADSASDAAERNGGHTLAEAQANFRRFLSMYDPAQAEPWMPEPPTAEEVRWKEELVRLYKRIVDPYRVDGPSALDRILLLEGALAGAERQRIAAADVPIATRNESRADDSGAGPTLPEAE
jgi:hypothetical protein